MIKKNILLLFFLLWGASARLFCQTADGKVHFVNPSFEDSSGESKSPQGWGSTVSGSTPDIFPGAWQLNLPAQHLNNCIGLVTREDGSTEEIGQMLHQTLKRGTCYTFSIYLRHAKQYVGYNLPARLRIWGGNKLGEKAVLLASSELIKQEEWTLCKFQFVPTKDVRCITFQAFFAPGTLFFYKGNILLDNCSPIERCDRA